MGVKRRAYSIRAAVVAIRVCGFQCFSQYIFDYIEEQYAMAANPDRIRDSEKHRWLDMDDARAVHNVMVICFGSAVFCGIEFSKEEQS